MNKTYYTFIENSIGQMLALSDGKHITGLYFSGQKYQPALYLSWIKDVELGVFIKLQEELVAYQDGSLKKFTVPYRCTVGTHFQQRVWRILEDIPYGTFQSYTDIAYKIGNVQAVRAVASAIGKNPLSILVPCHRVIGKNGSLCGYAAGLECKTKLLHLEQVVL